MNESDEFLAASAPRERPLTYPGRWPDASVLMTANDLWKLRGRDGESLEYDPTADLRLGHCRVRVTDSYPRDAQRTVPPFLTDVLEQLGTVSVESRVPVLSVGSNASPAQLRHKFEQRGVSMVVPAVKASVSGIGVGFAAVVAPAGYVPATIVPSGGGAVTLFIQWLDDAQLRVIDESEQGYRRVLLRADLPELPVVATLETGERLGEFYAYVAEGGYLEQNGHPIGMAIPGEPAAPTGAEAADQAHLIDMVLAANPELKEHFGPDPAAWIATVREHGSKAASEWLQQSGLIQRENAWGELPDHRPAALHRYGSIRPVRPRGAPMQDGSVTALVLPSSDTLQRKGESVVRVDRETFRLLGECTHVEVRAAALVSSVGEAAPSALTTVLVRADDEGQFADTMAAVEVDHVVRLAIGVHIGEEVILSAVHIERNSLADWVMGRPNYITARVTLSDPSTAERDVSLLSDLALQLLGVESGDHVVLEGRADEFGGVRRLSLKAFELPDAVWEPRERLTVGSWGARFPSPRDTLGSHPDIPSIFIDSATRLRLGIHRQQLATVRVRPARGHQFRRELREILLVLAVAFIGVVGLMNEPIAVFAALAVFVGVTVALVLFRMRRRLSHTLEYSPPRARRRRR